MNISMEKKYLTSDGKEVRILCIDSPSRYYPVVGLIGGDVTIWTIEGYICTDKQERNLDLVEYNPYTNFKIDEPVMVRDSVGEFWQKAHFAGLNAQGHPTAFSEGMSSWTAENGFIYSWAYCRRPTPEELCK